MYRSSHTDMNTEISPQKVLQGVDNTSVQPITSHYNHQLRFSSCEDCWICRIDSWFIYLVLCLLWTLQVHECKDLYWSLIIFACLLQVILQSETIQELTNTSKQLSSLQHEIAILRQTADAQKAENVICTAPLTICLFPKM